MIKCQRPNIGKNSTWAATIDWHLSNLNGIRKSCTDTSLRISQVMSIHLYQVILWEEKEQTTFELQSISKLRNPASLLKVSISSFLSQNVYQNGSISHIWNSILNSFIGFFQSYQDSYSSEISNLGKQMLSSTFPLIIHILLSFLIGLPELATYQSDYLIFNMNGY